jgi:hypothetical protein
MSFIDKLLKNGYERSADNQSTFIRRCNVEDEIEEEPLQMTQMNFNEPVEIPKQNNSNEEEALPLPEMQF